MRFNSSFLDEIRSRLPVSQVVAQRVKLKRQGREFTGLSPFKDEKTPSFTVNDQKAFYHCFASGEHGDIFTFLMKTEGLSFPEAVEKLAAEAGLEMPRQTPQMVEEERSRDRLIDLMETACRYFEEALTGEGGKIAARYIKGRGLSSATVSAFRLGYAPNSKTALKSFLKDKGYTEDEMARSGMVIHGDDIPVPYDRFRHRVIFPILDLKGRVIAFGGRALDDNQPAKYLNSPETELFHKGALLYNAKRARQAAYETQSLIAVEGYMDVIALFEAGIVNVVAPLGTALTPNQISAMWRMTDEPILCFDGDSAGQKAAARAVDTVLPLLQPGRSLRFAFLPPGMDPDDLVRAQGAEAFHAVTGATKPLVDMLWQREWDAGDWSTPERRARLEQNLRDKTAEIADNSVKSRYDQEIRDRLFHAWRKGPNKISGNMSRIMQTSSLKSSPLAARNGAQMPVREALILQTLLVHPWLLEDNAEFLATIRFENSTAETLMGALLDCLALQVPLDRRAIHDHLKGLDFDANIATIENAITHRGDGFTDPDTEREEVEKGWRHILEIHIKGTELKRELKASEKDLAEGSEQALERVRNIQSELHRYEFDQSMESGQRKQLDPSVHRILNSPR